MKVSTKLRISGIIYTIIFWGLTLAFASKLGSTILYLSPLIYLILMYVLMFTFMLFIKRGRVEKLSKALAAGDYKKVITIGEKQLEYEEMSYSKSKGKREPRGIIIYNLTLAIAYFAEHNDAEFIKHINNIDEEKYKETKDFYRDLSTKMFWLSLYYLQKSDFENAQMYYDKIENISEFHTYISFLDGIKFYKSGNVNAAKEKMNYVYTDLHQPVLKQIADEIISQ